MSLSLSGVFLLTHDRCDCLIFPSDSMSLASVPLLSRKYTPHNRARIFSLFLFTNPSYAVQVLEVLPFSLLFGSVFCALHLLYNMLILSFSHLQINSSVLHPSNQTNLFLCLSCRSRCLHSNVIFVVVFLG